MRRQTILSLLIFSFIFINGYNYSYAQLDLSEYKKTESGLYYKFYIKSEDGRTAQSGDMITLSIVHKSDNDSVFYSSGDYSYPYTVSMITSKKNADFYEALEMMAEGDSASFVFDSEVYYKNTFGTSELPPHIEKGSKMIFEIRILDFKTRSEMAYEQMKVMEDQIREEEDGIQKYIHKNNIKTKPSSSGLYYIEKEEGSGKQAFEGCMVLINYKAILLKTGKVAESTDVDPEKLSLSARFVSPGLIEGISKMKEGGKAKIIVPSHIGYGASGSNNVPPNSTLIYEIELLEVYE